MVREMLKGTLVAVFSFLGASVIQGLFHNEIATSLTLLGSTIGSYISLVYLMEKGVI